MRFEEEDIYKDFVYREITCAYCNMRYKFGYLPGPKPGANDNQEMYYDKVWCENCGRVMLSLPHYRFWDGE